MADLGTACCVRRPSAVAALRRRPVVSQDRVEGERRSKSSSSKAFLRWERKEVEGAVVSVGLLWGG